MAGIELASSVKTIYRQLFKVARNLEPKKQKEVFQQIREGFNEHKRETDEIRIAELLDKASSKLGFLRMITPKTERQSGIQRLVMVNGKLVEGVSGSRKGEHVISNWDGSNMDPDSVSRHYASLKRAGFQDNSHAKGVF
mmetsp:Transcript_3975/g.5525  ORF Transcript_3975/g.5525 Transcript_3975/m.5525 type:complete len:139 (+) Transcript_3975:104-520(+)